jgi:hypothetical protein
VQVQTRSWEPVTRSFSGKFSQELKAAEKKTERIQGQALLRDKEFASLLAKPCIHESGV